MCLLIWTIFSGEGCGPWASCFSYSALWYSHSFAQMCFLTETVSQVSHLVHGSFVYFFVYKPTAHFFCIFRKWKNKFFKFENYFQCWDFEFRHNRFSIALSGVKYYFKGVQFRKVSPIRKSTYCRLNLMYKEPMLYWYSLKLMFFLKI